jgi:hypothetical protein
VIAINVLLRGPLYTLATIGGANYITRCWRMGYVAEVESQLYSVENGIHQSLFRNQIESDLFAIPTKT